MRVVSRAWFWRCRLISLRLQQSLLWWSQSRRDVVSSIHDGNQQNVYRLFTMGAVIVIVPSLHFW